MHDKLRWFLAIIARASGGIGTRLWAGILFYCDHVDLMSWSMLLSVSILFYILILLSAVKCLNGFWSTKQTHQNPLKHHTTMYFVYHLSWGYATRWCYPPAMRRAYVEPLGGCGRHVGANWMPFVGWTRWDGLLALQGWLCIQHVQADGGKWRWMINYWLLQWRCVAIIFNQQPFIHVFCLNRCAEKSRSNMNHLTSCDTCRDKLMSASVVLMSAASENG